MSHSKRPGDDESGGKPRTTDSPSGRGTGERVGRMVLRKEETTQVLPVGEGSEARFSVVQRDRCTLTVLAGPMPGAIVTMEGNQLIIGRGTDIDVSIDDPGLSRNHARVFRSGEDFYVEDLSSTNGTFVSGLPVASPKRLNEGDRILMGRDTVLKFSLQDAFEQEAARRLYESAVRDPLTQVYNRRYLDERLRGEFAFAQRHGTPLSILMLDIDHFKQVNDKFGHPAGDEVLRVVAHAVQRTIRTEDLVARYGGEEFAVVARATDKVNAAVLGERIRRVVQKLSIVSEGKAIPVTLSVGIATRTLDKPFTTFEALIAAGDQALYAAKQAGRNCVISD